jgi:hypothetical protein
MTLLTNLQCKYGQIKKNIPSLLMIYRSDTKFIPKRITDILQLKPDVITNIIINPYDDILFEYLFQIDKEKVYIFLDGNENKLYVSKKSSKIRRNNIETLAHKIVMDGWYAQINKV